MTRKRALSIFSATFVGSIIFAAALSPAQPVSDSSKEYVTAFDVPTLFELKIDEVASIVGNASDDTEPTSAQIAAGIDIWTKTFTKDGYDLTAYYNPSTRVVKYFVASREGADPGEDVTELLKAANVSSDVEGYSVSVIKMLTNEKQIASITIDPETQAEKDAMVELAKDRVVFNSTFGNNYEAAALAKGAYDALQSNGLVDSIYLDLYASEATEQQYLQGGDEYEYANAVISASLNVRVSSTAWMYASESVQKDFTASFYTLIRGRYPTAQAHIVISNGLRDVATADTSWLGEMKLEIK